jgi:hypothetical protein
LALPYFVLLVGPALWLTLYTTGGGDCPILIVGLVIATAVGPIIAEGARRRMGKGFGPIDDMLVQRLLTASREDMREETPLTDWERERLAQIRESLIEVGKAAIQAEAGDHGALAGALSEWRTSGRPALGRVARENIRRRCLVVGEVLLDAAFSDSTTTATYGKALHYLVNETLEAVGKLLDGNLVSEGAFLWPEYYAGGPNAMAELETYMANVERERPDLTRRG